jgi:hypothetical protein
MPKQRGRGVPPLSTQQQALLEANRALEALVRELTNGQPRGFVVLFHHQDPDVEPFYRFMRLSDPEAKDFIPHMPDLVQLVRRYDPHHAFILFEATADLDASVLTDVQVSEQRYFFEAPQGWQPNLL